MKLTDFIVADAIVPNMQAQDRNGVIRELVEALAKAGQLDTDKIDEIIEKLIERETQGSTGIGKGIAVPHVKHSSVKDIVGTIGCKAEGVDFNSLDKAPVYSVFLLISPPNNPDKHLEAMENMFSHLQKDMFRKFLRQAETREQIIELLEEADESSQGNL